MRLQTICAIICLIIVLLSPSIAEEQQARSHVGYSEKPLKPCPTANFCKEMRIKYNRLFLGAIYQRVKDYFMANTTMYETFLKATEDTKTFFDVTHSRNLTNMIKPRIVDFRLKDSNLLENLRNELRKIVELTDQVKKIEFGRTFAPMPSVLDITFNYYHYFSPALAGYYDVIKPKLRAYLSDAKAINLEGITVNVGRVPTGIHNQGNQNTGTKFYKVGSDFMEICNLHLALTDVTEETYPLVFWEGMRPEMITTRYVYKMLTERPDWLNRNRLEGLNKFLFSWLEKDIDFWKFVLFQAEAEWDPNQHSSARMIMAGYFMVAKYYMEIYCNDDGTDKMGCGWAPCEAGEAVLFNPFQLHSSEMTFPPAKKIRNSIVTRICNKQDCKFAHVGYRPLDEKLYQCFAQIFGYNTTDEFKETIFGTKDNKIYSMGGIQLDDDGPGLTMKRLKDHYRKASDAFTKDKFSLTPATEDCLRDYLAMGGGSKDYDDL